MSTVAELQREVAELRERLDDHLDVCEDCGHRYPKRSDGSKSKARVLGRMICGACITNPGGYHNLPDIQPTAREDIVKWALHVKPEVIEAIGRRDPFKWLPGMVARWAR